MAGAAPYPADTRAKGWRFELDHERIRQSDTWALAAPEVRPWLLMLWMVAWEQTPCGSLPADDELIAARIGMPAKTFAKHRAVMLRGWLMADDGRLYHETITTRVQAMLDKRAKDAKRTADRRERTAGPRVNPDGDAGVSRVTPEGHQRDPTVSSTPSTKHQAPSTKQEIPASAHALAARAGDDPTPAGRVCLLLRQAGIARVNPGSELLRVLLEAGAEDAEFLGAVPASAGKRDPFAYVLSVVQGQRADAAKAASTVHRGPMPRRAATAAEQRVLDAVPGLAAPHLRPQAAQPDTIAEVIDVTARRLG